jgi:predicted MFS family arabinose efflux permease
MKNKGKIGFATTCMMLARGILYDRILRRKMITQLLIFLVVTVAIGSWVIDDWLRDGVIRFIIFWGVVCLYTLFMMLMAFYDMLKAMRGE